MRDAIGGALNHMADTLDTSQEQRRALSLKLVSSQEDERLRIARDLHDVLGHSLTTITVKASLAHRLGRTRDWVVISFHDGFVSGQRTVVTETVGDLRGFCRRGLCHQRQHDGRSQGTPGEHD